MLPPIRPSPIIPSVRFIAFDSIAARRRRSMVARCRDAHKGAPVVGPMLDFEELARAMPWLPGLEWRPTTENDNERRPVPAADPGQLRSRSLLRQPRHFGDAFRRRARLGAADAFRAVPVRRRGDWRSRWLRTGRRQAGRHAAAPGARPCQWPREPAQRASRQHAAGEHRRRPRHLSPAVRRPADVRHRRLCAPGVFLDSRIEEC